MKIYRFAKLQHRKCVRLASPACTQVYSTPCAL